MNYELKPLERCLTCHTEILIPLNATSVRCPACRTCMSISHFTQKEKQVVAEIERLRKESSAQGSAFFAQIDALKADFLASREGRLQELFRQGEEYQRQGRFDNAIERYETLLKDSPNESEVHWRIMLCRYGIEYVREQSSGQALPTITKMYIDNIQNDASYRCALQFASDETIRQFYQQEATRINDILMKYQHINGTQTPYDVFISVKQGTAKGSPTTDSHEAADIYHELDKMGLKVFNSRHSLKKYSGTEYEPYIMHALSTAKILIVVASSENYMNSPWVRNEWRRFRWLQMNNHHLPQNLQHERRLIAYILSKKQWAMPELGGLQIINAKVSATPMAVLTSSIQTVCGSRISPQPAIPNISNMTPEQLAQFAQFVAMFQQGMQATPVQQTPAPESQAVPPSPAITPTPTFPSDTPKQTDSPVAEVTPTTPKSASTSRKKPSKQTKEPSSQPSAAPVLLPSDVIDIKDIGLNGALHEELGKGIKIPLTKSDLEAVKTLIIHEKNVSDISALQYCIHLTHLEITNFLCSKVIEDISALRSCTALQELKLSHNHIKDISPLSGCASLKTLNLEDNKIEDISPLEQCTALKFLFLKKNRISDLSPLKKCILLTWLDASDNQIAQIATLSNFRFLNTLSLNSNQITDVRPLKQCTSLRELELSYNKIANLAPLSHCTALTSLSLQSNKITDIRPITALEKLKKLVISYNPDFVHSDAPIIMLRQLGCTVQDKDVRYSIEIEDEALYEALRKELRKKTGQPITLQDLQKISVLSLESKEIENISPLQYCTELVHLELDDNRITDITPLAHLKKLGTLGVGNNQISDIRALTSLHSLKGLYIHNNQITDLSPIASLTGLTHLTLHSNPFMDIRPLASLTALQVLMIHRPSSPTEEQLLDTLKQQGCSILYSGKPKAPPIIPINIEDVALEKALREKLCKTNEEPITEADLAKISGLSAPSEGIVNISALKYCKELKWLDLRNNKIVDISPLAGCTALYSLELPNNEIIDISPLAGHTALKTLDLSNNPLSNIAPLTNCTALNSLNLQNSSLSDISPLKNCAELRSLDLRNNQITDVSALANCTAIKQLYLQNNLLSDIAPLANCVALETLSLYNNRIADISPLASCTALESLRLYNNPLTGIDFFSCLRNATPNARTLASLKKKGCNVILK